MGWETNPVSRIRIVGSLELTCSTTFYSENTSGREFLFKFILICMWDNTWVQVKGKFSGSLFTNALSINANARNMLCVKWTNSQSYGIKRLIIS